MTTNTTTTTFPSRATRELLDRLSHPARGNVVQLPDPKIRALHRAILGMIDLLPAVGEDFPAGRRVIWLRTMGGVLQLVYGFEGEIIVEDMTPPTPKSAWEPWP